MTENLLQQLVTSEFVDRVNDTACATASDESHIYRYGIKSMVNEWAKNKEMLYNLLGKNLKISTTFELDATFEDLRGDLKDFSHGFMGEGFTTKKDGNVKLEILHHKEQEFYGFFTPSRKFIHFLIDGDYFESVKLNKVIGEPNPLLHANEALGIVKNYEGMKVTKVMRYILASSLGKMFDANFIDEEQYLRGIREVDVVCQYYSRLVEKIQTYKTSHTVWLSIDPNDFMRCSHGYDWDSCHQLGNMHGDGAVQYCINPTTMIAYEEKTNSGNDIKPLVWRQIVYTNKDLSRFIGSRQYKITSDVNTKAVQRMIIECMKNNVNPTIEWDLVDYSTDSCNTQDEIRDCIRTGEHGYAYNDINLYSGISKQLWMLSDKEGETCELETVYVNSLDYNICLDCGEKYWGHRDNFYTCPYCQGDAWCEICEEYHDDNDMIYIESEDRWVCENCVSAYYTRCDECGEYHENDEMTYVSNGDAVCNDCLDRLYTYCDECREYHPYDEVGTYTSEEGYDYSICDDCMDDCTVRCEECGERTYGTDACTCYYCDSPLTEEDEDEE